MPRQRNQTPEPEPASAALAAPRGQVLEEIEAQIMEGRALADRPIQSNAEYDAARTDFLNWNEYNVELLKRRFTTSEHAEAYARRTGGMRAMPLGPPPLSEKITNLQEDIGGKVRRLDSLLKRLPIIEEAPGSSHAETAPGAPQTSEGTVESIFIVHGHDGEAKLAVRNFLRDATKLDPVILHDQASAGMTVIEKFESFGSAAGFAVVILTADDLGKAKGAEDLRPRGRQNVVFEFGYFVGALRRARTVLLYEEGVELPSDLTGLVYIEYDRRGAWKMLLARELKHANIEVDGNSLI